MNITLRELEYFVAIAEHGHFGKAARSVHVSQPTLSMQFKGLEERLGTALIERLPHRARLTAAGEETLPLARQILRLSSEFQFRASKKLPPARLRVGIIPTISPYLLPLLSRELCRRLQGRRIAFVEAQTKDLVRMIREGAIESAILSPPTRERGLQERSIYTEPFYLAVNKAHPLAHRKRVSPSDLSNETLLLLDEGHCLRGQALSLCKLGSTDSTTDLAATSIEALRSMVALGDGVTLVPKLAIRKRDSIAYIPLSEPSFGRAVGIMYRTTSTESDALEALTQALQSVAMKQQLPLYPKSM